MNKLGILIKNYLLLSWGEIKYRKSRGRSSKGSLILIAVLGLFIIFSMTGSAIGQIYSYQPLGAAHLALAYSLLLGMVVSLLMAIMRGAVSNSAADAELLLALPVQRRTVIIAKSCSKYLFEIWPMAVFFLPALIAYAVIIGGGVGLVLRGLLLVLLTPLLTVGVSYILNWLFFKLGGRIKNPQTITTVLTMVFLVLYLVFIFSINTNAVTAADIAELQQGYYAFVPVAWGTEFAVFGSLGGLLLFACVTVLPFLLGVWLYAGIFGRRQRSWHSRSKEIDYRARTPYQALLKKELARYFGSAAYLINTGFGMVLLALLTVVVAVGRDSFLGGLLPQLGGMLPLILILIFCFCIATCYVSACSISMEGASLWILKAAPLRSREVLRAKLTVHLLVTLPLTVVCTLILSLLLRFSPAQSLAAVLLPAAYCLMTGLLGLVVNLKNPKLEWDSEDKVVKQSTAAMLGLLGGIAPAAAVFIPYFLFFAGSISFELLYLIALIVFLLLSAALWLWLRRRGEALFEAL